MAVHQRNGCRELLNQALQLCGKPPPTLSMCEFGNQRIKTDPGSGMRRLQSLKSVLQFFGCRHVSIDRNGKDGALPYNLGRKLPDDDLYGTFDICTNFGTIEHVRRGQYWAFWNAHYLVRRGGLMVHAAPVTGTCGTHGRWHYTRKWFEDLAQRNQYETLHLTEWDKSEGWPGEIEPGEELYLFAIFRKRGRRFQRRRSWVDPDIVVNGR